MRKEPEKSKQLIEIQAIAKIVESQLKPECRVDVLCYFLSNTPRDPMLGYIGLVLPQNLPYKTITHDRGIPIDKLWNTGPAAEWVISELKTKVPDVFL